MLVQGLCLWLWISLCGGNALQREQSGRDLPGMLFRNRMGMLGQRGLGRLSLLSDDRHLHRQRKHV